MKENNQIIQNRLKRAVEASVPDVLGNVLEQIETQEVHKAEANAETINDNKVEKVKVFINKKTHFPRWAKAVASMAAALVIVFGLWLNLNYSTEAVVAFDVNPSIELSVNRSEKILRVNPRNGEAETVIGEMDLKGINLDVAVNALIGSMVQKGYISDLNNSILITVNSKNAKKGEQLQQRLSKEVGSLLRSFSVDGSVMSQISSSGKHFEDLAKQYEISPGKAALIEQLVEADPTINYADVAKLSINDLNLLIEARQPQLVKVDISGYASERAYIGVVQAKNIAFEHAGVSESEVSELEIDYDYDDGRLIYEIEFKIRSSQYEYDIDARNGAILKSETKHEQKVTTKPTDKSDASTTKPTESSGLITRSQAEEIAFQHAGVSRGQVHDLETELEYDDGIKYYEVEFEVGDTEYDYEIDAYTGSILDYEIDYDD